jgi:hypothetical protein
MKPIAMRCNTSQYKKIKPILLQNGFIESNVYNTFSNDRPYLINNYGPKEYVLGFGCHEVTEYARNRFGEWNEDIFLEYCGIKSEWKLPKRWCVKVTEENAVILGEFYAKHSYKGYKQKIPNLYVGKYVTSHNAFSHNSLFSKYPGSNFCIDSPTHFSEITLEQFQTHVLKQKLNTMQTLTLGQLKDLYVQFGCTKWKSTIEPYLKDKALLKDDVEVIIDDKDIQLLLKEGSYDQKQAVEKLGIVLSNPIQWDKIKTGSRVKIKRTEEYCSGIEKINMDEEVNVVFYKTPHVISCRFSKSGEHPSYCTFEQHGNFISFAADENTDYIVSVIEY